MKRMVVAVALAAVLSGCATTPEPMVWVRTDGQSGKDNPALAQQYEIDRTVCIGEATKAGLSATTSAPGALDSVLAGCMAERGYILVAQSEAATRAAQLRAAPPKPPA